MKKTILAMAAAALTLGVVSCSKEQDATDSAATGGKATSLKVSLTFPRDTRATGDINATDDEAKVNNVDVFIYVTSSGAFSSAAHLTATDFIQGASSATADKYVASTTIPTTTGPKTVFVGINLPPAVVANLKDQTVSALYSAVQTMSRTELAGASNFAMFSVAPVDRTFSANASDPANNVTVTCKRLVAKVTVETDAALDQAGAPGILGNLTFAINNFNTKIFMLQNAAPEHRDPNWLTGSYVAGDFNDALATEYASVLDGALVTNPAAGDYTPLYASENTSQGKLRKEITRATVRATFIPQYITKFANGSNHDAGYTVDNNYDGVNTAKTFYAVTPSVEAGTSYFFDQGTANTFATDNNNAPITIYANGYCYWNIYLNKEPLNPVNLWDVLRNDWYKCNITRIVTPGRPNSDIRYPDLPPDVDTDITTDIEILFWNTPIKSDYTLE